MKIKDIKNRLNSELANITPNVLTDVTSQPINSLLKGENPVQAFHKRLTTWLLVFTLLIFVVMSVSIVAFYSVSDDNSRTSTYVSVTLTRDEEMQVFGIIADDKGVITKAVNFTSGESVASVIGKQRVELLPYLTAYEDGDEVYITFHSDVTEVASGTCDSVVTAITPFNGKNVTLTYAVNDPKDKMKLVEYINSKEEENLHADLGMKMEELCTLFAAI